MKVNCALIGCGYWGSKLKRYIEENPNFWLKYVCDSKSDLNEVWSDDEVHAVINATTNKFHYEITKDALLHGKHVLSEKPLALTAIECDELKSIAEERKLMLLTEYTYTFSKALKIATKMVERGEIGSLLGAEMSVRHLGRFGGGSVYWLLGSHMLSVLDMFMPLEDLTFSKRDIVVFKGNIETGVIVFENSDFAGHIVVSLNYPSKETKIILYGEEGSIIYDPLSNYPLEITRYERLKWTVADKLPKDVNRMSMDESNNLKYAIEYFYDCIQGKAESNIRRASLITRIIEKTESSGRA